MRVAVLAEFYPRSSDPASGIWSHRQSVAVRDAGAEIEVFVLHRLIARGPRRALALALQPAVTTLDGIRIQYVRYVSPPRPLTYARWGAWAAPALRRALRHRGRFDLLHAHYAVPAGDAALRAGARAPLVVSEHGGDVLWTTARVPGGRDAVERVFRSARLVLANSAGIERMVREHGASETRVVHLGADVPERPADRTPTPTVVTVAHLVARKRHADVLRALAELPGVAYLLIGDGPERPALERLARELGVAERVEFAGRLAPAAALARLRGAWAMAMPSTEEAFGVAYIEAMAAGVPAIGCAGEPGPEEIAAAGPGIELVPPRDPAALAARLRAVLADRGLGPRARATVERAFTWEACGRSTLAAYEAALG